MIQKSPFKFLDSFTKDDRDIFFGRDKEIEELHSRVFESKILVVYGTSGTGKSSLINCGLANKFNDSDWLPINVRRGADINRSLFEVLAKAAITKNPFERVEASGEPSYSLEKLLRSVYLDHFKPLFIIFDQFEELFIFGGEDEKNELIKNVAKVIESDIQCRFIFAMREEYLAGLTEFERIIPSFLSNRIRIEKMTRLNAIQTIEGPCRVHNIEVDDEFASALLEKLNPETTDVELTWLQIFLDKIMRLGENEGQSARRMTLDLLAKTGDVKDILGTFLEEQVSQLDDPETGLIILKSFISVKGTKHQITEEEVIDYSGTFGKKIDNETVKRLIQKFVRLRILRDKDENDRYELRHDSLASKIFEKITLIEKELLEVKYFIESAYLNYEKRHLVLSEEDLKYIAPYEDKLFLNEKNLKFIAQSKQEIHKARRRKQNIVIAVASGIILILSFFTIWAIKERSNAIIQQQIAENQKNTAIAAKEEADVAKQEAIVSRQKAEENEKLALTAKNQSEIASKEALVASKNALQQKTRAEQLSVIAGEQARKAEQEKQFADEQRILAQSAEEKAKRLSLISTAQNLALKSLSMEKNPELMGLLAVQAFNFNRNNDGPSDDPVIWEALNKAFSKLDSSKHSVFMGTPSEIWSFAENETGLLTADMDGNILQWNNNGISKILYKNPIIDFVDFISLSPDGRKMSLNYENKGLILETLSKNEIAISELHGHTKTISAAIWNNNRNHLITGGTDSLIIIWDTGANEIISINTIKAPSSVKSLTLCGNDSVISVHDDGSIFLWNLRNSTSELLFSSEIEKPLCLAWNKNENSLLAGCSNGNILLFKLKNKPYLYSRFAAQTTGINLLIFNDDCSLVATAAWDKVIRLYNYHKFFDLLNSVGGAISIENLNLRARSVWFTHDNKLVAGMSDKSIRIWETSSQKLVSLICKLVKKDMTDSEWKDNVGQEVPYEETCGKNP